MGRATIFLSSCSIPTGFYSTWDQLQTHSLFLRHLWQTKLPRSYAYAADFFFFFFNLNAGRSIYSFKFHPAGSSPLFQVILESWLWNTSFSSQQWCLLQMWWVWWARPLLGWPGSRSTELDIPPQQALQQSDNQLGWRSTAVTWIHPTGQSLRSIFSYLSLQSSDSV